MEINPTRGEGNLAPPGSLHPILINTLIGNLVERRSPPAYTVWKFDRKIISLKDKLSALHDQRDAITRDIVERNPHQFPIASTKWNTFFFAAKTMTFELRDRSIAGLMTVFRSEDSQITTVEKERLLEYLGYKVAKDKQHAAELSKAGIKIYSNNERDGIRFGQKSGVDLSTLGCEAGTVGPWQIPSSRLPVFILYPSFEKEYKEHDLQLVDFALSTDTSLIVNGFYNAFELINRTSHSLGHSGLVHFMHTALQ